MTKQEFLEMMRLALNGRVSSGRVMENLRYYEDYINVEVRKGRSEADVLNELGDPRLIARTIAETSGPENGQCGEARRGEEEEYRPRSRARRFWLKIISKIPVWAWLILALLIVAVVLSVVFSVIGVILPVLLPIVLVLFLVKVFRDWMN